MTNAHNNNTKNGSTNGTRRGKRRGFTLIEILIVVVILGTLAALVIPGVTSALDDANSNAATARASQITTMVTRLKQFRPTDYNAMSLEAMVAPADLEKLWDPNVAYCGSIEDVKVPGDTAGNKKWNYDATTGRFSPPVE